MSWRKISMKFPGTCIECNKKIEINEVGLWAQGLGVKHEQCAPVNELKCIVCGGSAGCQQCEFQDICDIERVSQLCICKRCSEATDVFESHQKSVSKQFPLLNMNS